MTTKTKKTTALPPASGPAGLFHSRSTEPVIVHVGGMMGVAGSAGRIGRTKAVQINEDTSAYMRTVRLHESLHLRHTKATDATMRKRGASPFAINAVEDARLHKYHFPRSIKRVARDELSAALTDIRHASRLMAAGDNWRNHANPLFRALTILAASNIDFERPEKHLDKIDRFAGFPLTQALAELAGAVQPKEKSTRNREVEEAFDALLAMPKKLPPGDMPAPPQADTTTGKARVSHVTLPMPAPALPHTSRRERQARRTGPRLSSAALSSLARGETPTRPCERIVRRTGGTVMIDASSSMGLRASTLAALVAACPTADVYYYDGEDTDNPRGNITHAAHAGKRAIDTPIRYHGNGIDTEAIEFLLKQPAPRVFVCDGGFTGPRVAYAERLATELAKQGNIVWVRSIKQAIKLFGERE